MRTRRTGTIVNISSTAGLEARASRSMYSASKFALEGMSEALSHETKPFGIRVLIVEPGAFGTGFADGVVLPERGILEEYKGTVTGRMVAYVEGMKVGGGGNVRGDVEKGAKAIFDVVMRSGQAEGLEGFLRLPLGSDGSERWEFKLDELRRTLDGTEKIWRGTDKDGGD